MMPRGRSTSSGGCGMPSCGLGMSRVVEDGVWSCECTKAGCMGVYTIGSIHPLINDKGVENKEKKVSEGRMPLIGILKG